MLAWAQDLNDPERGAAALVDLAAWLEATGPELDAGRASDAATLDTWLHVVRPAAALLGDDRALTLLDRAQTLAEARGGGHRAAVLAYERARLHVRGARLDEASAIVARARAADDSWIYAPPLELLGIRIAHQQGHWAEGLAAIEALLDGPLLFDEQIAAMTAPSEDQRAIGLLHRQVRAFAHVERGRFEVDLGRVDRGAADAHAALALVREPPDPDVELDARLLLAACSHANHDFEGTLAAADAIVAGGLAADDDFRVAFLRGLAQGELARTDPGFRADAVAALVRVRAEPELDAILKLDAEWMLADLALGAGDLEDAARWVASASERLARFDDDRLGLRRLRFAANEAELAFRRNDSVERLTALADELEASVGALLASWSEARDSGGAVGFLDTDERRAALGELARLLPRLEGPAGVRRAFELWLATQDQGSLADARDLGEVTLEEVQAVLPEGGGLLVFLETIPTTHLFLVERTAVEHVPLVGSPALKAAAAKLVAQLSEQPPSTAPEAQRADFAESAATSGAWLGRELLPQPVFDRVRAWTDVTVVASEFLWALPLEAALAPDGRTLGEVLPLSLVASLPLLVADGAARDAADPGARRDITLLAHLAPDAALVERFRDVVAVDLDPGTADRMLAPYAPERRRSVVDPSATRRDLLDAFDSSHVVQVLAHGVDDPTRERGTGLVLADADGAQGLLWAEELDDLPWRPRGLVVLASCGTALGPRRTGDDQLPHLAGGLLARGASGVVATRTRLELGLAIDLSVALHHHLTAGHSAAEALRRARVDVAGGDRTRALALAQVQLIGSPRNPLPASSLRAGDRAAWAAPSALAVAALLVGAVVVGAGLVARARRRALTRARADTSNPSPNR